MQTLAIENGVDVDVDERNWTDTTLRLRLKGALVAFFETTLLNNKLSKILLIVLYLMPASSSLVIYDIYLALKFLAGKDVVRKKANQLRVTYTSTSSLLHRLASRHHFCNALQSTAPYLNHNKQFYVTVVMLERVVWG